MKKNIIIFISLILGLTILGAACNLFHKNQELEVSITAELSASHIINLLAKDNTHPLLVNAITKANQNKKEPTEPYIEIFGKAFENTNPDIPLVKLFNIDKIDESLTNNSSNEETLNALHKEIDKRVIETITILNKRIKRFGISNSKIEQIENTERVLIEIPKVENIERVKHLIQTRAVLGFWETYDNQEIFQSLEEVNEKIKTLLANGKIELNGKEFQPTDYVLDTTTMVETEWAQKYPLFAVLTPRVNQQGQIVPGPCIGNAFERDTSTVTGLLRLPEVTNLLPNNLKLAWTVKPAPWDATNSIYELIALKVNNKDNTPPLDGTYITKASPEEGSQGNAYITITKNKEGAKIWQRLTADNIGRSIAITLDNKVYSYPLVNAEIKGGRSSISGDFNMQEASDLANVLQAHPLPAPISIVDVNTKNDSLDEN